MILFGRAALGVVKKFATGNKDLALACAAKPQLKGRRDTGATLRERYTYYTAQVKRGSGEIPRSGCSLGTTLFNRILSPNVTFADVADVGAINKLR